MARYDKKAAKKIAVERIERLFELAKSADSVGSKRYVKLAREIARKLQVKIPEKFRRGFCKNCNNVFIGGVYSVRIKDGFRIIKCNNCGKVRRFKLANN